MFWRKKRKLYTVSDIRDACWKAACGYNKGVFCKTETGEKYRVFGADVSSDGLLLVYVVVGTTSSSIGDDQWVFPVLVYVLD